MLRQLAEEAAGLYETRATLAGTASTTLSALRRWDDRVSAHMAALNDGSDHRVALCSAARQEPSAGSVWVAAFYVITRGDSAEVLFGIVGGVPEARQALAEAFAWAPTERSRQLTMALLRAREPLERWVGVAACAMSGTDPGGQSLLFENPDASVRARTLQCAGELGLQRASSKCLAAVADPDDDVAFRAAWSAVLLGDRSRGLVALSEKGLASPLHGQAALDLALQVGDVADAHRLLKEATQRNRDVRTAIRGCGIVGDPSYVPALVEQMRDPKLARIAGEAFTLIAGADLDAQQLFRERPEGFESGPTDDPTDEDVAIDLDEGLPWPDPEKVKAWWLANANRFQPGQRYFVGAPVTRTHCIEVLKHGRQRQRILAAQYLCLLQPGTPLFNTAAPAWRQQKLLASM